MIVNSTIGKRCKIADNVVIRNCVIWNGVTIKSGSTLDYNLVCSDVTIGENSTLKQGVMIDQSVTVKADATLEPNIIGSCLAIMTNDKGKATFKPVSEHNPKFFESGSICFLPNEMALKKHQFIGAAFQTDSEESDLEQSDEDESDGVEMTAGKFKSMIKEQMRQIFNKENSIDVALLNMRSWKHGYSGSHTLYLSVIIPAILG